MRAIQLCESTIWREFPFFFHLWTLKEQKGRKKVRGCKGAKGDGAKWEALIFSPRGWGSSKWHRLSPPSKKEKQRGWYDRRQIGKQEAKPQGKGWCQAKPKDLPSEVKKSQEWNTFSWLLILHFSLHFLHYPNYKIILP